MLQKIKQNKTKNKKQNKTKTKQKEKIKRKEKQKQTNKQTTTTTKDDKIIALGDIYRCPYKTANYIWVRKTFYKLLH